ncbi:MAG: hypothetical protein V2J62_00345, partial [candidate division KSB1 bacterium]|nr:hypothetical protein [candidate division KSB1 bacterium]
EKKETSGIGKKFRSGTRKQSGLNPNISVGGDFFFGMSSSKKNVISEPSDISYGNNRFELREMELAFVAPLDPFTRGKSFISVQPDAIAIEEAYMEWLNLPLNLNLKAGIFYSDFGILNRYHDHALPQFDRPKVLVNAFGNGGLGGCGFSGNFLLPRLFFSDASSIDLSLIRGGNDFSFTNAGTYNLIAVGHFKNYYDINRDTYIEWSLSGATGRNDAEEKQMSYLGDLALTLKWAPVGRAKYRTMEWHTEIISSRRETPAGTLSSLGFYSSLQNKINARYWLTARVGYSELPSDNDQYEWDITTCIDFWQSEFVFLRLQYQYSDRHIDSYMGYTGPFPSDHSLICQINWAMGPHKHEKY